MVRDFLHSLRIAFRVLLAVAFACGMPAARAAHVAPARVLRAD